MKDSRFSGIANDPRFRLPRKKELRGDVDSRFKSALSKEQRTKRVDKYGRKVEKESNLERLYNLDNSSSDSLSESKSGSEDDSKSESGSESGSEHESKSESQSGTELVNPAALNDREKMRRRMRGEESEDGDSDSDSSSDDESDSDEDLQNQVDEYENIRGPAPRGDEAKRFAAVNMDWDNITAVDLMAAFSSFAPKNRRIISVKIYPSSYGKQRMKEEEISGPPRDLFETGTSVEKSSKSNEEDDEDQDYSSSKLRKYQLQRLQYYYAVVECDSVSTAAAIYDQCEGAEYESTANFFDLRYVPDDMEFDDKPRDECFKVPAKYEPTNFATDALQHSKVKLTWDETPKERSRLAQKAFSNKEIESFDLKAYLASDSESDNEDTAAKYKSLLGIDNKEAGGEASNNGAAAEDDGDDVDMEITFNPVLEGKEAELERELTTVEKYKLKEKERRKRRMEAFKARKSEENAAKEAKEAKDSELELLAMDDDILKANVDADADAHETGTSTKSSSKSKSKKGKDKTKQSKKGKHEDEETFDTQDPRFQALFDNPDYAIDPTVPQFKKTPAMESVVKERRKRQQAHGSQSIEPTIKKKRLEIKQEDAKALANRLAEKLKARAKSTA